MMVSVTYAIDKTPTGPAAQPHDDRTGPVADPPSLAGHGLAPALRRVGLAGADDHVLPDGLPHQMRSPLAAVASLLDLLDGEQPADTMSRQVHQRVKVRCDAMMDMVDDLLRVADTGIGIPRGEQDLLFSEFFRASNAKRVAAHSSGLGLSIVKSIVEKLSGQIRFESCEEQGTTFEVRIPVVAEPGRA